MRTPKAGIPEGYLPCDNCGHCKNPEECVWGVACPECGAPPKSQCTRPGGLVPLHEARWELATGRKKAYVQAAN